MSFSRRKGLDPKRVLQTDDMDEPLRVGLWNIFYGFTFREMERSNASFPYHTELWQFSDRLWFGFFKLPIDQRPTVWEFIRDQLRDFFLSRPWNRVYDLLEFTMDDYPKDYEKNAFRDACNFILEREMSAYRIVGDIITELTSQEEIEAITKAQEVKGPVEAHLVQALRLLSDREKPDHRNSVKESISAVESMCQIVAGLPKATLGQAIKRIEEKTGIPLPPALREAFNKLYGWTSDSQGIRHALSDEAAQPGFEEAMFMLVTCSAFINYLRGKTK